MKLIVKDLKIVHETTEKGEIRSVYVYHATGPGIKITVRVGARLPFLTPGSALVLVPFDTQKTVTEAMK